MYGEIFTKKGMKIYSLFLVASCGNEKLYQELGFESLKDRRWMKKRCNLYKVISSKRPSYLYYMLPPIQRSQRNQGVKKLSCPVLLSVIFMCLLGDIQ